MSDVNPTRNNIKALPRPTKTLQATESLKGVLTSFELKPSDYKEGTDRLVLTVLDKTSQSYFVNIALGGGDAYAQIHKILEDTGVGAVLDISVSTGYKGRNIKVVKPKP